jgi:hypothetical protein
MGTMHSPPRRAERQPAEPGGFSLAWIAVAFIPVFLVLAFVLGEGVISWLGYSSGGSYPWWVGLCADLTAGLVALLPCAAAVWFALRSRRAGEHRAWAPLLVGGVVGAALLVVTIASITGDLTR